MWQIRGAAVVLLVFFAYAFASVCSAAIARDGDPGTIGWAIRHPDGTTVTLTGEEVLWRGRSGKSFAIKEWFEKPTDGPRLIVASTAALAVEECWSVDVTGTLRTLPSRNGGAQRVLAVSPADVLVYCGPRGCPCRFIPVKLSGDDWPSKRSLVDLFASVQGIGSVATLSDAELPPMPDSPESEPLPPAAGSRDSLKWLPDGAPVSVNGAIVSAVFDFDGTDYDFFYVEKADRSFGIWVSAPASACAGDVVDVKGWMGTGAGGAERLVAYDPANPVVQVDYG